MVLAVGSTVRDPSRPVESAGRPARRHRDADPDPAVRHRAAGPVPDQGPPPSGLQDGSGRLIDGDHNGTPGGNAVAVLSRHGASVEAIASGTPSRQDVGIMAIVDA